ncbi:hypothetical protein V2I01_14930 [Micromonospora sp. BRA006-A]|nr:hypothetical protein [Micromonospora sp. BRA006-A]
MVGAAAGDLVFFPVRTSTDQTPPTWSDATAAITDRPSGDTARSARPEAP